MRCGALGMAKRGIGASMVSRIARVDIGYVTTAALSVVVGFSRAIFAAKGGVTPSTRLLLGKDRDLRGDRSVVGPAYHLLRQLARGQARV